VVDAGWQTSQTGRHFAACYRICSAHAFCGTEALLCVTWRWLLRSRPLFRATVPFLCLRGGAGWFLLLGGADGRCGSLVSLCAACSCGKRGVPMALACRFLDPAFAGVEKFSSLLQHVTSSAPATLYLVRHLAVTAYITSSGCPSSTLCARCWSRRCMGSCLACFSRGS